MGVKIAAHNLEHAVAGTQVMVVTEEDMLEEVQDAVQGDLRDAMAALATEPEGVYVQASTLGALEALMEFLRTSNIPVCGAVFAKDCESSVASHAIKNHGTIIVFTRINMTVTDLNTSVASARLGFNRRCSN